MRGRGRPRKNTEKKPAVGTSAAAAGGRRGAKIGGSSASDRQKGKYARKLATSGRVAKAKRGLGRGGADNPTAASRRHQKFDERPAAPKYVGSSPYDNDDNGSDEGTEDGDPDGDEYGCGGGGQRYAHAYPHRALVPHRGAVPYGGGVPPGAARLGSTAVTMDAEGVDAGYDESSKFMGDSPVDSSDSSPSSDF